jgi:hypothetical protein
MTTMKKHFDVLLVGSMPMRDAEEVFRAVASTLGDRVQRIPDGETGPRRHWIEWQASIFEYHPMFVASTKDGGKVDWRNQSLPPEWRIKPWRALRPDAARDALTFGPLGYAQVARQSYGVFARLKQAGIIQRNCKFQIAIPTPYNVIDQRIDPDDRLAVEAPYEKRMLAEIDEIAAAIPHDQIVIQWDTAHEVQNLEGGRPHWFNDPEPQMIERLVRLGNHVPPDIELGYHFCYGSLGGRHIVEPKDTGVMVRLSNAIAHGIGRAIDFLHMPVPRDHTDAAYFAPLKALRVVNETRLYLGLLHLTDGVAGAQRRISAARTAIEEFGIAAECGFGRATPAQAAEILRMHARVSDLAAEAV